MTTIAERIPLYVPQPETGQEAEGAVLCRAVTHRGLVRLRNEDSFCVLSKNNARLFVVADGLGGHRGGSIASKMAVDTIQGEFETWNGKHSDRFVVHATQTANQAVFSTAQDHPELFSMQTTATTIVLDGGGLFAAHVGDCRLYRVRDGKVNVLTKDHSQAAELLRMHLISAESAQSHPGRHQLTRSVGSSPFLRVDLVKEKIKTGDSYILCSDGLWSEVSDNDVKKALSDKDIESSLEELIGKVLKAGAPDNITGILFRINNPDGTTP